MADREKIIKGLECCIKRDPDDKPRCTECPYDSACLNRLKVDALELLKALDVTPEELEQLKMCRHECKVDCLLESFNKVVEERDELKKTQEAKVKTKCNTGLTQWYVCTSCDASVNPGDRFCRMCGKVLVWG